MISSVNATNTDRDQPPTDYRRLVSVRPVRYITSRRPSPQLPTAVSRPRRPVRGVVSTSATNLRDSCMQAGPAFDRQLSPGTLIHLILPSSDDDATEDDDVRSCPVGPRPSASDASHVPALHYHWLFYSGSSSCCSSRIPITRHHGLTDGCSSVYTLLTWIDVYNKSCVCCKHDHRLTY